jgi:UDP-glucose 4-epimerase
MKRVLITGANSYVGTNVDKWLMKEPDKYYVETLDMKDPNWKEFDFSKFDVVFHVAGIAHVSAKKKMKDLYFKVNRDLAIETAEKAKGSGVKQFIFMSSMIVYNSKETRITKETKPNPDNFYGESKLQAEQGIQKLQDDIFKVCILRPPMIYGPNSKGNFLKLIKSVMKIHVFPKYDNKRSMLYIYNLCEFIRLAIENSNDDIYFPQNSEYVNIVDLIRKSASLKSNRLFLISALNVFLRLLLNRISLFNKIFGDRVYEKTISDFYMQYNIFSFEESLKYMEKKNV